MPKLLDSLNLPWYSSESKKNIHPGKLVCTVDYEFDQWSVVSSVIKKLAYLFMMKQCIYLVIQMYFMQIYFYISRSRNKFPNFFMFSN